MALHLAEISQTVTRGAHPLVHKSGVVSPDGGRCVASPVRRCEDYTNRVRCAGVSETDFGA